MKLTIINVLQVGNSYMLLWLGRRDERRYEKMVRERIENSGVEDEEKGMVEKSIVGKGMVEKVRGDEKGGLGEVTEEKEKEGLGLDM